MVFDARRYRKTHLEQHRESNRKWRIKNREHTKQYGRNYYYEDIQRSRDKAKETRERLRNSIFDILGKKCVICGFADIRALQFDHINGHGSEHRRSFKWEYNYFRYLRDNPDETKRQFQILCSNCNLIKRYTRGEN